MFGLARRLLAGDGHDDTRDRLLGVGGPGVRSLIEAARQFLCFIQPGHAGSNRFASSCWPAVLSRSAARRSRPLASSKCRLALPKLRLYSSTRAPGTEPRASNRSLRNWAARMMRPASHLPDEPQS